MFPVKKKMKIIFTSMLLYKVCTFVVQKTLLYLIGMDDGSHTKSECVQNVYKKICTNIIEI
jgi:hypothetical protein